MATEKKNDKERSVEERLKALYQLQTILSEIDRIKILRGELPHEVKDLEDEIARYETRIKNHREQIEARKADINVKNGQIADRRSKIARYEEQIQNVTNNREYSYLEKEKEFEGLEIELAEKKINEAKRDIEQLTEEINAAEAELEDNRQILEEKRQELEDIVSETRVEEENLREKAKKIEPQIDAYTLAAFKRIRKNARNGLGIVTVERNACGGCFNRIPPQRQLEIRMHKKIIVCEYCGRIIIDNKLAGIEEPTVEATPTKPTRRRSTAAKSTRKAIDEALKADDDLPKSAE